ncbi:MAG: dUTP diphosphatase [Bacteroidales bacterium]|nr:dUTP diphosphatase [Bacteroidales bacterium]
MENKICKVYNQSNNPLPAYESARAAGLDLRANLESPVTLMPGQRQLIPTGLFLELPDDCEAQVRPRSGLAMKHGITVLNTPGTIDADYRGEVKVLLINLSDEPFEIQNGERIAQMVVSRFQQISWEEVDDVEMLSKTERGAGGFGHSGKK